MSNKSREFLYLMMSTSGSPIASSSVVGIQKAGDHLAIGYQISFLTELTSACTTNSVSEGNNYWFFIYILNTRIIRPSFHLSVPESIWKAGRNLSIVIESSPANDLDIR